MMRKGRVSSTLRIGQITISPEIDKYLLEVVVDVVDGQELRHWQGAPAATSRQGGTF